MPDSDHFNYSRCTSISCTIFSVASAWYPNSPPCLQDEMQTCGPWHHRVKGKMEKGGALYQFLFDSTQYLFLSSCDNRMQGYVEAAPAVDGASFEGNSGTHSPWMIQLLSDVLADELKFFFQTGKDDHQPPAKLAGVGPASSPGHDCRDEDHLRKKGVLEIRVRLGRYLSNHMKPTWQENTHRMCTWLSICWSFGICLAPNSQSPKKRGNGLTWVLTKSGQSKGVGLG